MEYGRYKSEDGLAVYSSNVVSDNPEARAAFLNRVGAWAAKSKVKLGEGTITTLDDVWNNGKIFYLKAPIIEGSPGDVFFTGDLLSDGTVVEAKGLDS